MNQSSQNTTETIRVAFVQARWHADIVDEACKAFIAELGKRTNRTSQVDVYNVPGAFEIPLQARMLTRAAPYDAIVACAFVVDGGIYRHEFVAETVVNALMQVQMETHVPVLSVVLTPHHFHESAEHKRFFRTHFKVKGREAAEACLSVLAMREDVRSVA